MTQTSKSASQASRRDFLLAGAWGVSLAALVGQAGSALLEFLKPRIQPGAFGGKVTAGRVAEFKPGKISHVASGRFYISHTDDGLIAMWQSCTHLGCTVPWVEEEDRFHCPCHSSLYNKQGEVIGGPAPRPLDLFPIEIDDKQRVIVDTSNPIQRTHYDPSQAAKV